MDILKVKTAISLAAIHLFVFFFTPAFLQAQGITYLVKDTHDIVERFPEFPGGEQALLQFINQNIRYPKRSRKKGSEGKVITTFVVNAEGSVEQIAIIKGVDPDLDNEVIRMIKSMPKWKPGEKESNHEGKITITKVNAFYTLPVTFRLEDEKKRCRASETASHQDS
jgi:TonB family protein